MKWVQIDDVNADKNLGSKSGLALYASHLNDLDGMAGDILARMWSGTRMQSKSQQSDAALRTVAVATHGGVLFAASNALFHELPDTFQPQSTLQYRKAISTWSQRFQEITFINKEISKVDSQIMHLSKVHGKEKVVQAKKEVRDGLDEKRKFLQNMNLADELGPDYYYYLQEMKQSETFTYKWQEELARSLRSITKKPFMELHFPMRLQHSFTPHAEVSLLSYFLSKGWTMTKIGVSKPCCVFCSIILKAYDVSFSVWSPRSEVGKYMIPQNVQDNLQRVDTEAIEYWMHQKGTTVTIIP